ncbi:MAG: cell surface protein SprA [Prolixibacteraceae bacterium]
MRLRKIVKNILLLTVLVIFYSLSGGVGSRAEVNKRDITFYSGWQSPQDTVRMDTAGNLRFPFEDQPAFGFPENPDTASLFLKKPENIGFEVEYDPVTGQYLFYEKVGRLNYRLPQAMTLKDYVDYDFRKSVQEYWQQRKNISDMESKGSLIPGLTIESEAFNRIFGGNTINIKPQGYVEVSFGYQMNATENPAIPERLRRVPAFDFDQKIQMNVMGQIGTKMNMRVNYNTEATFDYENKMNLEYTGEEDEIIKRIEAGNVSLPLNGSLITGASNLFGIKAEMQFGKLTMTTLFSQHKGETRTVETEGGAQITNFDIPAAEYDANRHFFLSQYFRDNYDEALRNLPVIRSGITINKIEVWVTNKSNNFTESRNIIAFQDLGEHDPNIFNKIPAFQQTSGLPFPANIYPNNDANGLYGEMKTTHSAIRSIQSVTAEMAQFGNAFTGGRDFEKIEQARKLNPSEYNLNTRLGYISLNTSLNNDEILAVAYNYTVNGQVYQVGEFSNDGVDAPQTLILKLIKGTNLSPVLYVDGEKLRNPSWDLMMKNVYNLNAYQLTSDNFILNVMYMNDSTGMYINYIPEGRISGHILLNVMNLDKLNKQQDPYKDGVFDFIEGITVNASTGRIIFPVLEPFGSHLADSLQDTELIEKYTYRSLYDSTRMVAQQDAEHDKYRLMGSYKGSSSSDIMVGGFNLSRGSVKVTAGGRELVENVDYTVDYTLGRVTVINPGLLESGTPIQVSTESEDLFSMQRKSLLGAHANYAFSDRFNLGATALYMQERPLTQKVDYGQDPIANLILGLDSRFSSESQFLTKAVDMLPFISTKAPSTIDFEAEFAKLIPGHSRVIEKSGNAYIDDFEGTKTSIDLKTRQHWVLASTPQNHPLFPEGNLANQLDYGFNRALLAWYIIDPLFLRSSTLTPSHIKNDKNMQSNHLVREVFEKEIFPAKESPVGEPTNIAVFDLAFYPGEKGPYNFDTKPSLYSAGVNADGSLRDPGSRWGGIMRKIDNSDFETANIEFIEFWLMDPFVNDSTGLASGGDLYFNLGDISEDILRDGRKSFENGLPVTSQVTNVDTTIWGRVSTQQSLVNAFDNNPASRAYQDLGFDGLNDDDESSHYRDYLEELRTIVSPEVYERIAADPSKDNYHYYRGSDYDDQELSILERYKRYNGPQGNSPTTEMSPESYPTSASTLPDMEDINSDNTLNEYERYYQYRVSLRKQDMELGKNYINDIRHSRIQLKNGEIGEVKWYQFKIPVREYDDVFGSISDFKSIRFLRLFLNAFEDPVVLRFATLDLVRADWRRYTRTLTEEGSTESANVTFDVSAVNIEENGGRVPVNYILPPGIDRVIDPANPQLLQLNEQAMVMKVTGLEQGDARAAYKSIYMDFRRYKRLKMEIHAEEIEGYPIKDDELTLFIRMGSDYTYNYYEYEIPLKLTPAGRYNGDIEADRYKVWPLENRIDVPLEVFTNVKLARDAELRKANSTWKILDVFEQRHMGWNEDKNLVKVKGSPNLGNIQVMMIGIRHRKNKTFNPGPRSIEVWANELRLSEFDEKGGWAANARVTARLADLGTVTLAGRHRSAGFGSIEQKVNQRSIDNLTEYDIASSIDLGRFFPKEAGVNIPMYYGYSKSNLMPKYDPTNPDIELQKSLDKIDTRHDRDSLRHIAQNMVVRKSLNFTNVRVDPQSETPRPQRLWSPGNFAATYSYNEIFQRNTNTEYNIDKIYRGMLSYNFNTRPELWTPFSKVKLLQKGPLKLIGDFNLYPLPTQLSLRTDLYRRYNEIQTRNITNPGLILPATFEKDFLWNRYFDLRYDMTRNLKVDFSSRNTSRIDEPEGRFNRRYDDYEWKRDSIVANLMELGRPVLYNHDMNVTYTLPLSQIKALNFITVTGRYQGSYNWQAGAITADTIRLGNIVQNSQNIQFTGNVSLVSIYNKIPYLQKLETKFQNTGRSRYGGRMRQSSSTRSAQQQTRQEEQKVPEFSQKDVTLNRGEPLIVNHKLGAREVTLKVTNQRGQPVTGKTKVIDKNNVEFTPADSVASATILVTGKIEKNIMREILDYTLRITTGVRNVSVNYNLSGGSVLPGYLPEPVVFGAGRYTPDQGLFGTQMGSSFTPGLPFLLGWQDRQFARNAGDRGWLTTDPLLNMPFQFTRNERFSVRADVEPLPDLRIDINADRSISKNLSEFYNYDPVSSRFKAENLTERGNFSMSVLTWNTAFFAIGKEEVQQSEAFQKLKENRLIIARRLAAQRPANNAFNYDPTEINPETGFPVGYGPTSVEVLVPAFLAAYQGIDPYKVSLGMFPSIKYIRPNWRIQYEGMISKIPRLNKIMKTMNFTHAFRSSYTVGSFLTNLNYLAESDGFSYVRDIQNNFLPRFEFNSVSINENFSPLINLDVTWINDLTTRGEIKRSRSMALSFSNNQLTEILSNEYIVGLGYRFTRMDLILKTKTSQRSYSNDLTLRADLSFRKNKTVLRRLVEDTDQLTAGMNAVTIKTTADYMLSDRFQLRVYYDKVINQPFVGSFDTSNTNFGVSFRFTLAE